MTQEDLLKLETMFRGETYCPLATSSSFDATKLETLHRGEVFWAVPPASGGEPEPPTAYNATQMFAVF